MLKAAVNNIVYSDCDANNDAISTLMRRGFYLGVFRCVLDSRLGFRWDFTLILCCSHLDLYLCIMCNTITSLLHCTAVYGYFVVVWKPPDSTFIWVKV